MPVDDRRYLEQVVRNAGVPSMWEQDAASDVWLRCWLKDDWRKVTINSAAIDAARKYGWRTRRGKSRVHEALDSAMHLVTDPYAICDRIMDAERAIATLSKPLRATLAAEVMMEGRRPLNHYQRLLYARKRLRRAVL